MATAIPGARTRAITAAFSSWAGPPGRRAPPCWPGWPRSAPASAQVVLDAYALGALPPHAELAAALAGRLVLTPNAREAGILLAGGERYERVITTDAS